MKVNYFGVVEFLEAVRSALAEVGFGPGYLNCPSSKRALSRWVTPGVGQR